MGDDGAQTKPNTSGLRYINQRLCYRKHFPIVVLKSNDILKQVAMGRTLHLERHRTDRIGWLRAAVLGANDGIVSTASLVVGVAAANAAGSEILVAGVAGLFAAGVSLRSAAVLDTQGAGEDAASGWKLRRGRAARAVVHRAPAVG